VTGAFQRIQDFLIFREPAFLVFGKNQPAIGVDVEHALGSHLEIRFTETLLSE